MRHLYITISSILLCVSVTAQDSLQYLTSTSGAACFSILYYDGYLYTGNGNTFNVHDASKPLPYPEVFEQRIGSAIDDIQRVGDTLYITANHAGLLKWNISDRENPRLVAEYRPDSLKEAAYDVSFSGDSIFLANKSKVSVLQDKGNTFELLTEFAFQTGNSKVRGGAIKDSLYAYAVAYGGATDGIYIVNKNTLEHLSYYQQTYCDPEDVSFGKSTKYLHVLGGTQSLTNPLDASGAFYSLDVNDPTQPTLAFYDTVKTVWGLGISAPMNVVNINDTLYVVTQAGMAPDYKFGEPAEGQTYVYDASSNDSITYLTSIYGGLWHFDADIYDTTLFVASEWFGIETVGIRDIYNETRIGKTLTGGWNWGTGVFGNKMVLALGGYGFEVYDISDPRNPVKLHHNNDGGFCKSAEWSKDGKYIFNYYLTGDGFRVFDAQNYNQVGSITKHLGDQNTYRWNDYLVSQTKPSIGAQSINIIDASDPLQPREDSSFNKAVNDIFVTSKGKVLIAKNDSLLIWNLDDNLAKMTGMKSGFLQQFKAVTEYKDTIYAFLSGKGLMRYIYDDLNTITLDTFVPLPLGPPRFMAADSFGLYLCYIEEGLYAFDKISLEETGYHRHSLELIHTNLWGPRDLFCENNLIFLAEFHGQTTILSNDNGMLTSLKELENDSEEIRIFPNPASEMCTIVFERNTDGPYEFNIIDINGKLVKRVFKNKGNTILVNTTDLLPGTYLVNIKGKELFTTKKLIVD